MSTSSSSVFANYGSSGHNFLAPPSFLPANKGKRSSYPASSEVALHLLRDLIKEAEGLTVAPSDGLLDKIRNQLHKLVFVTVNRQVLRDTFVVDPKRAAFLQMLFIPSLSSKEYPTDVKADAKELCIKWYNGDFDGLLMRNIRTNSKGIDVLDDMYQIDAHYFGEGDLVNGQWFASIAVARRVGAHGEIQRGICGDATIGAYSVVVAKGEGYHDRDYGDEVMYSGTRGKGVDLSDDTKALLQNFKNGNPVRLLRSHLGPSELAPSYGYRYDGLYNVVSQGTPHGRGGTVEFRLVRQSGQDPIRGGNVTGARPTDQEVNAWKEDQEMRIRKAHLVPKYGHSKAPKGE